MFWDNKLGTVVHYNKNNLHLRVLINFYFITSTFGSSCLFNRKKFAYSLKLNTEQTQWRWPFFLSIIKVNDKIN